MGFFEALGREYKYLSAILRLLRSTKIVKADSDDLICDFIESWVDKFGSNIAFIEDDKNFTFDEFDTYANRVAGWAISEGA